MPVFEPFFDGPDLTACVDAATTVAQVNALGAPHQAWFPLGPDPEQSLGDLFLGTRVTSRSFRFGTVGDNVLGMRWQLPNGHAVDLGGRVVKNVAGFDLVRFLSASHGRFGRPLTLVLRLRPKAEAESVLRAAGTWDQLKVLARIIRASSWAHAIDALDLDAGPAGPALSVSFTAPQDLLPLFQAESRRWAGALGVRMDPAPALPVHGTKPWARAQAPQDLGMDLAEEWLQRYGGRVTGFLGNGLLQIEPGQANEQGALQGLHELHGRLATLGGHVEHPSLKPDADAPQARWETELLALMAAV